MKNRLAILLAICLMVAVGCGSNAIANNVIESQNLTRAVSYEEPRYQLDTTIWREQYTAEDGTELLEYSYQLLELSVVNPEAIAPEEKAAAQLNAENFNDQMAQRMAAAEEMMWETLSNAQIAYEDGYFGGVYTDETTASGLILGQIISVRLDNYSYSGGAHPHRFSLGSVFDLTAGRFIDPAQLADDPESFRVGVAALLVEKADAMGEEYTAGYWSDYREIIAQWNEGSVLFDENGMTVHYSPYEIGPYAMGDLDLFISYEELAPLMGPGGMAKLGVSSEAAE